MPGHYQHGDVVVLAESDGGVSDVFGGGPLLHEMVEAVKAAEFALMVAGFDDTVAQQGELLTLGDVDSDLFRFGAFDEAQR